MAKTGTAYTLELWILAGVIALLPSVAVATVLPLGFVETPVIDDLVSPTAMAVAPDGRIFVAEQDGRVRIVKNSTLLEEPFVQLPADNNYERGLLGITLDPEFATNHYVYVYYAALGVHACRLVRYTADGDHALPGSETLLVELPPFNINARYHFGGAMHFGPDGKLYLGVGDHSFNVNAQSKTVPFGKVLRLNSDGSIPQDNPFYGSTTGINRAIWAYGLRNPFTLAFDPETGRLFINDVGQAEWEEIDEGVAGANYGWPTAEGPSDNPAFTNPVFAYPHGAIAPTVGGCAITGGTFYSPAQAQFPDSFEGGYFFADFCGRYIRWLDPVTLTASNFIKGLPGNPTDLDVAADGSLYVLVRPAGGVRQDDPGAIYRIFYTGSLAPQITVQPESETVLIGDPVTFHVEALGADSYQWQRGTDDIEGATSDSFTIDAVSAANDGEIYRVIVHNEFGDTTSADALLATTDNHRPVPVVTLEAPRELYRGGDEISFSGTATDLEDGPLGTATFSWRVDFHHNTHFHPFVPPTSGVPGGDFTIGPVGETATDVWYRVNLRVTDSGGRTGTAYKDIFPDVGTFTVKTKPAGLEVIVDGRPFNSGTEFQGVIGLQRTLAAAPEQIREEGTFTFDHWSDGMPLEHTITVPEVPTTYTAFFLSDNPVTTTTLGSPDCGNGVVNAGEECDDGDNDFDPGDACRGNCQRIPCGKPTNSSGDAPTSSDALFTLRAAVGDRACSASVCDVDQSGAIVASDALAVLRAAVGLGGALSCLPS